MSSNGPIRRTVHACVQCRERKQKCGGVTDQATCVACSSRKVACSFEDEARDPRFNPYLRIQSTRSPDIASGNHDMQNELRRLRDEVQALRSSGSGSRSQSGTQLRQTTNIPLPSPIHDQLHETIHHSGQDDLYGGQALDISFDDPSLPEPSFHTDPPSNPLFSDATSSYPAPMQINNIVSLPESLSEPSPDGPFHGPMKVLQELGAHDGFDLEIHDPIARHIITYGEASIAFRLFFTQCHLNAPFLDPDYDADMPSVRSRNMALFLNIIVVGARFWSHKSRRDTWLHPRYSRLVTLLDGEMSRLTLRPRPADICLETVQAWMIYSHWMPIDVTMTPTGPSYRSRFTESSVWQCLGLATRWATLLGLDQTAYMPLLDENKTPSRQEVRNYRTMLYLTESDHYLALSARRPSTLSPTSICQVLPQFLRGDWTRATDTRLASLMRVVGASYVMGARAESEESLEAFNMDVNTIEQHFLSCVTSMSSHDKMGQHFPFTSLRWYRLAFASTLLPPAGDWRNAGEPLRLSVDWASQILYHLSSSATVTTFHLSPSAVEAALEPDEGLVGLLSFAIDQYFVVIAYTASFLVLAWQNGAMDNQLRVGSTPNNMLPSTSSTLYRLVDLASRTLRQCAPTRGHPASRYADFLAGMANIVAVGPINSQSNQTQAQAPLDVGAPVWDQDWLNLWQNSGLEQDWLFGPAPDDP